MFTHLQQWFSRMGWQMFGVLLSIVLIFRVLLRIVMIAPSTLILSLHVVGSNKIVLQTGGRGNHMETEHLADLGIHQIILKCILKKWDRRMWGIYLAKDSGCMSKTHEGGSTGSPFVDKNRLKTL